MPAIVWDVQPVPESNSTKCDIYLRENDRTIKIQKDLPSIFLSTYGDEKTIEQLDALCKRDLKKLNIKTEKHQADGRWLLELRGPRALAKLLDKNSFEAEARPTFPESAGLQIKPFSIITKSGELGEQASVEDICNQTIAVIDIEKQDWEENSGRTPKICSSSICIRKPNDERRYYSIFIHGLNEEGLGSKHFAVQNPLELTLLSAYVLRKEDPGHLGGQNIQKYDFEELKMKYRLLFFQSGRDDFLEGLAKAKKQDVNLEEVRGAVSGLENAIEKWYETGQIDVKDCRSIDLQHAPIGPSLSMLGNSWNSRHFENKTGIRTLDEFVALLSYINQTSRVWAKTGVMPFYLEDRVDESQVWTGLLKRLHSGKGELPERLKGWLATKYGKGTKASLNKFIKSQEPVPKELREYFISDFQPELHRICREALTDIVKKGIFLLGPEKEEPVFESASSFLKKQGCTGVQIIDTYPFSQNHFDLPNDKLATIAAHLGVPCTKDLKKDEITPLARAAEAGDRAAGTKLVKYNISDVKATLDIILKILPVQANLVNLYETDFATLCTTSISEVQEKTFGKQNYRKKNFWHCFEDLEKKVLEEKFGQGLGLKLKTVRGSFENLYAIYPLHIFRALEPELRGNPCGDKLLRLFEAESNPIFKIIYAQHLDELCARMLLDKESDYEVVRNIFALGEQTPQGLREKIVGRAQELKNFLSRNGLQIVNASKRLAFLRGRRGLESLLQANQNLYLYGATGKAVSERTGRIAAELNNRIYSTGITLDRESRKGDLSSIEKEIREGVFNSYFSKGSAEEAVRRLQELFSGLAGQELEQYLYEDKPSRPLQDYAFSYTCTRRYKRMEQVGARKGEKVLGAYIMNKGFVPCEAIEKGDVPDIEEYRRKLFGACCYKSLPACRCLSDGMVGGWLRSMFNVNEKNEHHLLPALSRLCEGRASGQDFESLVKAYNARTEESEPQMNRRIEEFREEHKGSEVKKKNIFQKNLSEFF